jgi:nitroreductase
MDFLNFVASRYSVRSYDPSATISSATLLRIAEAGRMAPSAANRQPWKLLIIQSEEVLNEVHKAYPAPWFADAPVIIAVVGVPNEAWVRKSDQYCSIETDLTILMDHLLLAAHAEGVSSCWIAAFDPLLMRKALKLSELEVVYAVSPLGYPKPGTEATRPKARKAIGDLIVWM